MVNFWPFLPFDFLRLPSTSVKKGNQMIWHDLSILTWHDSDLQSQHWRCNASSWHLDPLHCQDVLGTDQYIAQEARTFWLLSIDISIDNIAPRHRWSEYFDINEHICKGKCLERGSQCFHFLKGLWWKLFSCFRHFRSGRDRIPVGSQEWKPVIQPQINRLWPLCYSQKLPHWTSADVRLLTAKFPYRADIFDDEVWDGLWSRF